MAISKGHYNNKCWRGCSETGTLIHVVWNAISTTIMESSMAIPQKAKARTAIWFSDTASAVLSFVLASFFRHVLSVRWQK
jgi:spermidine/putrescine-binding protein